METQLQSDILAVLTEHGPASAPEVAELLDAHPATVERRCTELQQRDRVQQVTGGQYAVVGPEHVQLRTASD